MAIQFRRGLESLLNKASLVLGEQAFCSDSKKLFISNGDGTAIQVLSDVTHANGTGQSNTNKVDHAIYADGSSLLYVSVSAAITLTNAQFGSFIKLTGTTYTVGVPTPVGNAGKIFEFYNAASGVVTLSTPAGSFVGFGISSGSTYAIASGQYVSLTSDGSNWFTVDSSKGSASSALAGSTLANQIAALAPISQPAWITPTLLNSWVTFGAPWMTPGYYKDSFGIVRLRGMVKNGASSTDIFQLPAGCRPIGESTHSNISGGSFGAVSILSTTGGVESVVGSNSWVSLDGITFRAEQ
jgi:hypothetical protein